MHKSFSKAVEAAKKGKRIARSGWNGKGMFVFMRLGDTVPADISALFTTLPISVREFLEAQNREITFLPYLCMYAADGSIVNGWLASQTDILAEDWVILD